jgi:hypothetical protein
MWIFAEWEDQTPDRVLASSPWIPQSYVDAPVRMIKLAGGVIGDPIACLRLEPLPE